MPSAAAPKPQCHASSGAKPSARSQPRAASLKANQPHTKGASKAPKLIPM